MKLKLHWIKMVGIVGSMVHVLAGINLLSKMRSGDSEKRSGFFVAPKHGLDPF